MVGTPQGLPRASYLTDTMEPAMHEHRHVPLVQKCTACGKRLCWLGLGTMISFPIEHGIYRFVPGFKIIGRLFGM